MVLYRVKTDTSVFAFQFKMAIGQCTLIVEKGVI